jgi:hypothetical protein
VLLRPQWEFVLHKSIPRCLNQTEFRLLTRWVGGANSLGMGERHMTILANTKIDLALSTGFPHPAGFIMFGTEMASDVTFFMHSVIYQLAKDFIE